MPEISVIIPTHNRNELLNVAVESVLNQSLTDIELIVVDDTVEKAASDVVMGFKRKSDIPIKYLHNPNPGAPVSRNLGIGVSTGRFIAFLDDDDYWYKDKLLKQYDRFSQLDDDYGVVYSWIDIEVQPFDIVYKSRSNLEGDLYRQLLFSNIIGVTITPLIKTEILKKTGGFDTSLKARMDYDLWIRLAKICKFAVNSEVLARSIIRIDMKRISSSLGKIEESITQINSKYSDDIDNIFDTREKRKRKAAQFGFIASQAIKLNNKKSASAYYRKAFLTDKSPKNLLLSILSGFSTRLLFQLRKHLN